MITIDIQIYAGILLVLRIVSMTFMSMVIAKQVSLFKFSVPKKIRRFRVVLFALAIAILIGNFIPAGINTLTILDVQTGRPAEVHLVSTIYTLNASLVALLSSYLIWRLYRLAANEKEITDLTAKRLTEEKKRNRKE